ncbi:hypothetical protein EV421DRAFT_1706835 [Armillaria borealis]|uniref:Transposase domain-containing protein n=1 Tax=Armillaria borealis TaxID=47425 RepID=A0AA39JQN2_9AGAR|nr:hypothetical protein EV421DRAFT_1706835 [Armillaria borealis]
MQISLPQKDYAWDSEADAPVIEVEGVWHRSLTEVITSAFQDPSASEYHLKGFKEMWQPSEESPAERIYGEVYTSPVYLEMEEKPQGPLENVVVPVMVYSDSTHLTNFGDVSLWPGYFFIGLLSKYISAMPDAHAAHHFVYMPELPDLIQDMYKAKFGEPASSAVLTHLKRELIQAVWCLLLDDEFKEAYQHGLVVECWDGICRCLFPRFFVYSADYPEKVLMACLKTMGTCLCPRCLVRKSEVEWMGTINNMKRRVTKARVDSHSRRWQVEEARKTIFLKGKAVNSAHVESFLKDESLTPTRSAFSEFFQDTDLDFNFYILFIVDLMHEFELGVFKALFIHLVRICYAIGAHVVQILNERYNFHIRLL